eukprot:COSAG02_NODE_16930_length_1043_cov_1.470339_2_plen_170_part_00
MLKHRQVGWLRSSPRGKSMRISRADDGASLLPCTALRRPSTPNRARNLRICTGLKNRQAGGQQARSPYESGASARAFSELVGPIRLPNAVTASPDFASNRTMTGPLQIYLTKSLKKSFSLCSSYSSRARDKVSSRKSCCITVKPSSSIAASTESELPLAITSGFSSARV